MNMIVKFIRLILNFSIALSLTFGPLANAADVTDAASASGGSGAVAPMDQSSGRLSLIANASGGPNLNVDLETKFIDVGDVEAELSTALRTDAETIIVSSDDSNVLAKVVEDANTKPADRVFVLPFGKAIRKSADVANGANQFLRSAGRAAVDTFHKDKIGFSIATFTLANEIVRWVHVSDASTFVVTSNIIYTIVWAALFVNKDTWSKTTKPIQKTFRKLFGLSNVIPDVPTTQDMAIKFLSGLTLSMMLNGGRATLIGIDQFSQHVFQPLGLTMPFIMGAVMTAVGFSWSELMGSVDETRFPRAKKILRLVLNSRSCLISYFAASAMLMNPEHYGFTPWIAVTLSGITGLLLYKNAKRLVPFLEGRGRSFRCENIFSPSPT